MSDRSPGCQILDIVHNKAYRMKFKLKGLKRDMEESCEDNNEMCYNKFIGPIRDHKANDIFFISPKSLITKTILDQPKKL